MNANELILILLELTDEDPTAGGWEVMHDDAVVNDAVRATRTVHGGRVGNPLRSPVIKLVTT